MKAVYEKYLKDFNKYEASVNNEKIGRDPFMDHVSSHM